MNIKSLLFLFALVAVPGMLQAAPDTWTDGASAIANGSWSTAGNWDSGVPTSTSDVVIGTMAPGDDIVGIDTGTNVTVNSFTFASSLDTMTAPPVLVLNTAANEQLTVTSGITNDTTFQNEFHVIVNAGGNATYAGGAGLLFSNPLNVGKFTITTTGSVTVAAGNSLDFDINSLSSFGSIGAVNVQGATIEIFGTYTGHAGDTFDLTTGNFDGATLGQLPTLAAGLSWDTSDFFADGRLTVDAVPEPSTYGLMLLGGLALLGLRKRQAILGRLVAVRSK